MIGGHDMVDELYQFLTSHRFGKYGGLVVDNDDPTHRGRLKVTVPRVLGKQELWALPCVPYAGDGVGFYALPEPGTNVWVEFEGGDPSYPIWAGCFWGDDELPTSDGAPVKILKTAATSLTLDDDAETVVLTNDQSSTLTLDDTSKVESPASGGTASVEVGGAGVTLDSGAGATVEATSTAVQLNGSAFKVGA